jgi:hypothetical protein
LTVGLGEFELNSSEDGEIREAVAVLEDLDEQLHILDVARVDSAVEIA